MTAFLIFMTGFFANGVRAMSGFGGALIFVPLITMILDLQTAAPAVALANILPGLVIILYHRDGINWNAIWRVLLGIVVGVPIGVYLLGQLDTDLLLLSLGVFIVAYTLYSMIGPELPQLQHQVWAYVAGVFTGLFGGAYNIAGPPSVIYATMSRWPKAEFKSTLNLIFLLTGVVTLFFHQRNGNITPTVLYTVAWALPGGLLGSYVGLKLSDKVEPDTFRRIVYVVLLVLGANLIRSAVM